ENKARVVRTEERVGGAIELRTVVRRHDECGLGHVLLNRITQRIHELQRVTEVLGLDRVRSRGQVIECETGGASGFALNNLSAGTHTVQAQYLSNTLKFVDSLSDTIEQDVSKSALVVASNNSAKLYGSPNPLFSSNYSGFVL